MPLSYTFGNVTQAQGAWLDTTFQELGNLDQLIGTASGTNAIVWTPFGPNPTVAAYYFGQRYAFYSVGSNTSATTFQIGSLAALPIYRDTVNGPIALVGGEIHAGNYIVVSYDNALNSGGGGFHLLTPQVIVLSSPVTAVSAGSGTTLTAAQLTGNGSQQAIIVRSGPGSGFSDTIDTAANIVSAIAGCQVFSQFDFHVNNLTSNTMTIVAGASITLVGPVTVAGTSSHTFYGVVTNVGTPAAFIYG